MIWSFLVRSPFVEMGLTSITKGWVYFYYYSFFIALVNYNFDYLRRISKIIIIIITSVGELVF
jgi:hypothetical protein